MKKIRTSKPCVRAFCIAALAGLLLVPAGGRIPAASADPAMEGLPPAPDQIGAVHRDANGQIVPGPPPGGSDSSLSPAVSASPAASRANRTASGVSHARRGAARAPAMPSTPGFASQEPRPALSGMAVPAVPAPRRPGDITGLRIVNLSGEEEPAGVATFGQVFVRGDLPAGSGLRASDGGHDFPLQMDVKTHYADGSVDLAVLSLALPALKPGQALAVMLARGGAQGAGQGRVASLPAMVPQSVPPLLVKVTFRDGPAAGRMAQVALRDLLSRGGSAVIGPPWLHGSLVTERRARAPLGQGLVAQFDVRLSALGPPRIDLALTYDGAYSVPMRSIHYDVTVTDGDHTLLHYADLKHNHHADWHQVLWPLGRVAPEIVRDPVYWVRSGAVPAFDTSVRISSMQVDADYRRLEKADTGPMGTALLTPYMPTTGQTDSEDVGLITDYQAKYLLSQDPREAAVMFAQADAAGSIPWHFRDEHTGLPITITSHPGIRICTNGPGVGKDKLPETYSTKDTGWTPDTAHAPALDYLPYLLTGSHYYLDELQFHAAWILAFNNPIFRGGAAGLLNTRTEEQTRGVAWDLRTYADAAYATPDNDPFKAYFTRYVKANLDLLVQHYIVDRALKAAGPLEGWVQGYNLNSRREPQVAPWQQAFLAMTLGYVGQRGFPAADRVLRWMGGFLTGLYLNADAGFDPRYASAYELQVTDPATRRPFDSWAKVFTASFQNKPGGLGPSTADLGYPKDPGGYAAAGQGALASLITAGGGPRAVAAYATAVALTESYGLTQAFSTMPKWAIAPSFPGGGRLLLKDIHLEREDRPASDSGGDSAQMLITGPAGGRLMAGAGDDILVARGGPTIFAIAANRLGHQMIVGFDPLRDRLEISNSALSGASVQTVPQLLAHASRDTEGDLKLILGPQEDVTLVGIGPGTLPASAIRILH